MKELINCKQLATFLGRSQNYVTAMRRAGYKLPYPGRTTTDHALLWLMANPDFRCDYWLRPSLTKPEKRRPRKVTPAAPARRRVSAAGKSH